MDSTLFRSILVAIKIIQSNILQITRLGHLFRNSHSTCYLKREKSFNVSFRSRTIAYIRGYILIASMTFAHYDSRPHKRMIVSITMMIRHHMNALHKFTSMQLIRIIENMVDLLFLRGKVII